MKKPKPIEFVEDGNEGDWCARFLAIPQMGQVCAHCDVVDNRRAPEGPMWIFDIEWDEYTKPTVTAFCPDCGEKELIRVNRMKECEEAGAQGKRLDACTTKKKKDEDNGPG